MIGYDPEKLEKWVRPFVSKSVQGCSQEGQYKVKLNMNNEYSRFNVNVVMRSSTSV